MDKTEIIEMAIKLIQNLQTKKNGKCNRMKVKKQHKLCQCLKTQHVHTRVYVRVCVCVCVCVCMCVCVYIYIYIYIYIHLLSIIKFLNTFNASIYNLEYSLAQLEMRNVYFVSSTSTLEHKLIFKTLH